MNTLLRTAQSYHFMKERNTASLAITCSDTESKSFDYNKFIVPKHHLQAPKASYQPLNQIHPKYTSI